MTKEDWDGSGLGCPEKNLPGSILTMLNERLWRVLSGEMAVRSEPWRASMVCLRFGGRLR